MSIYSLAQAQQYLDEALATRSKILKSQEYKLANRSQRRAELSQILEDIKKWEDEIKSIYALNPNLRTTTQKVRRGPTVSIVGFNL